MSRTDGMECYVVTQNPRAYPGKVVVRVHHIYPGKVVASKRFWLFTSLEAARSFLGHTYPHLVRVARDENDDPVIVETWL